MNDYYENPGALRAAEERLLTISKELEAYRLKMREMALDYDAATLRARIAQINRYDESVQLIISSDPRLQEAWDNFRVQYQLTARKELLETAREKIAGQNGGECHGCRRPFPSHTEKGSQQAKSDNFQIRVLEQRVEELTAKLETIHDQ